MPNNNAVNDVKRLHANATCNSQFIIDIVILCRILMIWLTNDVNYAINVRWIESESIEKTESRRLSLTGFKSMYTGNRPAKPDIMENQKIRPESTGKPDLSGWTWYVATNSKVPENRIRPALGRTRKYTTVPDPVLRLDPVFGSLRSDPTGGKQLRSNILWCVCTFDFQDTVQNFRVLFRQQSSKSPFIMYVYGGVQLPTTFKSPHAVDFWYAHHNSSAENLRFYNPPADSQRLYRGLESVRGNQASYYIQRHSILKLFSGNITKPEINF